MPERHLDVFLDRKRIGILKESSGIWAFRYDNSWATNPGAYPLSPGLPLSTGEILDGSTERPVQWYFDNLLAEGGARDLLAKDARISNADAFGLLEHYGGESAGALTLLKPGEPFPEGGRRPLSGQELFARIRNLPNVSLVDGAPKRMSLAGAQHKLPVILDEAQLYEPTGAQPSTHILKPDHRTRDQYPSSAANEWFVMRLAAAVGLEVPEVWHHYCPEEPHEGGHEAYYLIQRFDRRNDEGYLRRVQSIDACQLLNKDATFKYHEMSVPTLLQIAEATRSKAATRLRLFRWCLFNAIVGNRDAHLKNLSFHVSERGIELAPHYDLVSTALFDADGGEWLEYPMSIQIGNAARYRDLNGEAVISLARQLRIAPKAAQSTMERMTRSIDAHAARLIEEFGAKPFPESGEAQALQGGATRVLRQIRSVVMAEVLRRIS